MRTITLSVFFAAASLVSAAPPPFDLAVQAARRQTLLEKIPKGAILFARSGSERDEQTYDAYRPDSDFWYLTGLSEPDAVAVLDPEAPAGKRYVLFVRPKEFAKEQWTGWRAGVEGAKTAYGADEADTIDKLDGRMRALLKGKRSLYLLDAGDAEFRKKLVAAWSAAGSDALEPRPFMDAGPVVHQMRLVKDPVEIALLRRAAELSMDAHREAMKAVRPGAGEWTLKARMVGACLEGGAARMAYPPIVGSGPNSVVLHYARDERILAAGDIIVNDTACEYGMYAADVTRSYPVSGTFSPEQKAIYEVVLKAQKDAIAKIAPGVPLHEVYDTTVSVVVDGLLSLGILKGDKNEIIRTRAFRKLYPHGSSHWLGLDVHDAGSYEYGEPDERYDRYRSANVKLAPGMALTVEPGIYIPQNAEGVDAKWWNLGVRIEDDILVTRTGADCLTCGLVREVKDVENALRSTSSFSRPR